MTAERGVQVSLSDEVWRSILENSLAVPDRETGGILMGRFRDPQDGPLRITAERSSGPGEGACLGTDIFRPEMEHYRERMAHYRRTMGLEYVGEWHKHPGALGELSRLDIRTAREICETEGWPFLLLPIVTLCEGYCRIHCFVWVAQGGKQGCAGGEVFRAETYERAVEELLNEKGGSPA